MIIGQQLPVFHNALKVDRMAKSTCPVTRAEFVNLAKPVEVVIDGIPMTAEVKEFSTGSLGWYLNGKANIKVGEKSVSVQIGMNLTIVGSKELSKEYATDSTKIVAINHRVALDFGPDEFALPDS